MLIGKLAFGAVMHTITWSSHRSSIPIKSSASAEVLSAKEPIEDGTFLDMVLQQLVNLDDYLNLIVDSIDLFNLLSICRTQIVLKDLGMLRKYFNKPVNVRVEDYIKLLPVIPLTSKIKRAR